ncbi:hypothetical protein LSTR_LSTR003192 [Laodelphax striatellus]|uniref:Uncharacterized protein n=1 Tax=Laodelphax striatellus TaxID=195883 RepID=A0A482XS52_LAOST|nr:hypothetical protein LSTR_LSTR003192 [Laodelphax striatellus]
MEKTCGEKSGIIVKYTSERNRSSTLDHFTWISSIFSDKGYIIEGVKSRYGLELALRLTLGRYALALQWIIAIASGCERDRSAGSAEQHTRPATGRISEHAGPARGRHHPPRQGMEGVATGRSAAHQHTLDEQNAARQRRILHNPGAANRAGDSGDWLLAVRQLLVTRAREPASDRIAKRCPVAGSCAAASAASAAPLHAAAAPRRRGGSRDRQPQPDGAALPDRIALRAAQRRPASHQQRLCQRRRGG